ncbi:50S ribosomal protein L11 [Thelohanellus kitauei]|uniref:Large ribosomal subunit protein uL11m n=1 Tax=Thelohanellus kitauei TaxID=669202 RepID=A0A0C2MP06_THEKT|nr:50S ribosomal protein L11 [Thelohanellus kitauei]
MKLPAGTLQHISLKRSPLTAVGIDIKKFATRFNELTSKYYDNTPIRIFVYYQVLGPTSASFLISAAGISRGAKKPGHVTVGSVTPIQLYEIAKLKSKEPHLKYMDIQSLVRCLADQCRSIGIRIKPHEFHPNNRSKNKPIQGPPIVPISRRKPPPNFFVIK